MNRFWMQVIDMFCWYYGEYKDIDPSSILGFTQRNMEAQKETYPNYIGLTVGDFRVLDVAYDWGRRCQRVETECVLCGETDVKYLNFSAWRRGRGESRRCRCRKKKSMEKEPIVRPQPRDYVGERKYGWIAERVNGNQLVVKCEECGKTKLATMAAFSNGKIKECNHKICTDYSDPKWIGAKNGHLTAIKHNGKYFECLCDCGNIVQVQATYLFTYKSVTSCCAAGCQFSQNKSQRGKTAISIGDSFEKEICEILEKRGYQVEKTRTVGDFGVDIIIKLKEGRVAIQCKRTVHPATVSSIQEVYAGGRFYDCNKFAVISPSGFTENALKMAAKLGVYCSVEDFNIVKLDDPRQSCVEMLNTLDPIDCWKTRRAKTHNVMGEQLTVNEASSKYGVPIGTIYNGLSAGKNWEEIIQAPRAEKKVYTVDGFTGTIQQIAERHGMLPQTVAYRMKYCGMSLEDAVNTPLKEQGRPKAKTE